MKAVAGILILVSMLTPAAAEECIDLAWKVPNEYIAFDAVMEAAKPEAKFSMNFDGLMDESEANKERSKEFEDFEFPKTSSMTAVMSPTEADTFSVKLIMGKSEYDAPPSNEQAENIRKMMDAMAGTVQLRGEIDARGKIVSFYLPQRQKNLINIFFELPGHCVSVGDEWSIDLSLIEMDQNFIKDTSRRVNNVKLVSVEKRGGAVIAVLDYFVLEAITGTFQVPMQEKLIPTEMNMGYTGRGRFNVTEGRWEQFAGTLSMESSGVMTANGTQLFALRPRSQLDSAVLNAQ